MNPLYIADIFILVCCELGPMKKILQLELLSSFHSKLIRNHGWTKYVYVPNDILMNHIINNYRFKNLASNSNIDVNKYIMGLKNCHILDLSYTNITDASVRELKNCHTLDLRWTNITDASVRELK